MKQLGELQGVLESFAQRQALVVAISVDPVERARAVVERLGLGFPVLADPDLVAIRAFGVEDAENGIAWPAVFVLDAAGRVRWRSLSDDYRNRPTPAELLSALDAAAAASR